MMTTRLRLALQKKGRLADESLSLLRQCGLQFRYKENALLAQVDNFPIDLLFVRDDDIPGLIFDGICDAGIVGENVLFEKMALSNNAPYKIISRLNSCTCRLAIAVPLEFDWQGPQSLMGTRIATSYPNLLGNYLKQNELVAECIPLSGSVEMAPRLGMSDVICDLVSTGQTLEENELIEVDTVLKSQASFIQTSKPLDLAKKQLLDLLCQRIQAVNEADTRKYVVFHAPQTALKKIYECLPNIESPTMLPLGESEGKVSVQLVSKGQIFWDTLERIKSLGASSIMVLPIEKMLM